MKIKIILLLIISFLSGSVYAKAINPSLYRSMSANAYRNNYNRQVTNRVVPYWQAQANYSTRNRLYQNYSSYNNYMYQHSTSVQQSRGYR